MSSRYAVGKQKIERRGSLEQGTHPVVVWVLDERFGLHATSIAAKRAFVEAMWPDMKGSPDEYIKRFFDRQARSSMPHAKVVKVPLAKNGGREPLYHGSNDPDLEELDGNDPGYTGSLGWGLYLTTDPDFAKIFGKHIYEVESPVPDELVAEIEPMTYDCGNSLTFYTPGSTPFTFEIPDRKTGETHRYSILGDCDEQVKDSLRADLFGTKNLPESLHEKVRSQSQNVRFAIGEMLVDAIASVGRGERIDEVVEGLMEDEAEENDHWSEDDLSAIETTLTACLEQADTDTDQLVAERLGTEIDLSDISATVAEHGYSAFFISGYAPGDEYVIVDEKYLPIPVTK